MPSPALDTLRRLQRAQAVQERRTREALTSASRQSAIPLPGPRESLTREGFLELVYTALGRVDAVYTRGAAALLSEDERQAVGEAEDRVERAYLGGDFETAREALEEWERGWLGILGARSERA